MNLNFSSINKISTNHQHLRYTLVDLIPPSSLEFLDGRLLQVHFFLVTNYLSFFFFEYICSLFNVAYDLCS